MKKIVFLVLADFHVHLESVFWMILSLGIFLVSLKLGEWYPSDGYVQRGGSLIALIGGWAAYRDFQGKLMEAIVDAMGEDDTSPKAKSIFANKTVILKRSRAIEIALVSLGTLISTFGDWI